MIETMLVCPNCSKQQELDSLSGQCDCGYPFLVVYDLDEVKKIMTKSALSGRPATMWRYQELLPVKNKNAIVSLGEGWTPLIRMNALEKQLPVKALWIKREEQNPTGSFKARGFSMSISLLNERGMRKAAVPSNGNAASAMAAYAARAGMSSYVFVPKDCPTMIVNECIGYGAKTYLIDGLIHDAGKIIEDGKPEMNWFNVGTVKEPGRIEGKKTMGLELAEQLGWRFPDVIIYPTGGGSGVVGMWKAFHELKNLKLVEGEMPRMVSVQETGCQPIVTAVKTGAPSVRPLTEGVTASPTGMRVPLPAAGDLILAIIRETGGTAVAVDKTEIEAAQKTLGSNGISASPEGAATWAGLVRLCDEGFIRASDQVVLFNTSHALKYLPAPLKQPVPVIRTYEDFASLG